LPDGKVRKWESGIPIFSLDWGSGKCVFCRYVHKIHEVHMDAVDFVAFNFIQCFSWIPLDCIGNHGGLVVFPWILLERTFDLMERDVFLMVSWFVTLSFGVCVCMSIYPGVVCSVLNIGMFDK